LDLDFSSSLLIFAGNLDGLFGVLSLIFLPALVFSGSFLPLDVLSLLLPDFSVYLSFSSLVGVALVLSGLTVPLVWSFLSYVIR
jgi:hypothetical protein